MDSTQLQHAWIVSSVQILPTTKALVYHCCPPHHLKRAEYVLNVPLITTELHNITGQWLYLKLQYKVLELKVTSMYFSIKSHKIAAACVQM